MGLTKAQKAEREAQIVKETTQRTDIPIGMGRMKNIELPDVRKLTELFSEMRPADVSKGVQRPDGMFFCSAQGLGHWYVTPSLAVGKVLKTMSRELGIHFKIIMRDSGTALITATYDRIIGGRWLAVIDGAKVRTACKGI